MTQILHIVCPHCDAINRLDGARLGELPQCGKCHRALFDTKPIEVTAARFQKHISRNDIPVVVDFWAPWCGPCKMMAPEFEKAARELEPSVRLVKVNTENEQALAGKFGIRSIPTTVLFKDGREIARQPGAMSATQIVQWVKGQ